MWLRFLAMQCANNLLLTLNNSSQFVFLKLMLSIIITKKTKLILLICLTESISKHPQNFQVNHNNLIYTQLTNIASPRHKQITVHPSLTQYTCPFPTRCLQFSRSDTLVARSTRAHVLVYIGRSLLSASCA